MYKISVIVPVYNAESTIETAIKSVIKQTIGFENIELILVDDASNDNSKMIIEKYSNKYENIKFIKLTENTGLPSKPRNIAIENSTAPYLMFLDNDDILPIKSCETLYNAIEEYGAEIGCCEQCSKFIDGFYAPITNEPVTIKRVEDKSKLRITCWGYIFKTDFINKFNVRFPLLVPEDGIFITEALGNASDVIHVQNFYGYSYTVETENEISYIHNIDNDRFLDYLNGHYYFLDKVREYDLNEKILLTDSVSFLILMFIKVNGSRKTRKETLKKLFAFEKELNFDVVLPSVPLNTINKFILNENYGIATLLCSIGRNLYKNRTIKNLIFRKYSNLQKIES